MAKNTTMIFLLILLAVVFFIIFLLFAFNVQIQGDSLLVAGIVFGLVCFVVILLMIRGKTEEQMKAAVIFVRGWWDEMFHEKIEERNMFFVQRFWGHEKFFGGWVQRGSGRIMQKSCIVLKKTSNGFEVAKFRETASTEDEKNPFFGLETITSGDGMPVPHPLIPQQKFEPTEDERRPVVVNVGRKQQEEEEGDN